MSADRPLVPDDPRLPEVRARLFLLVRSLARQGTLGVPISAVARDAPALALLPPLWRRLRLELLGPRLLDAILPAIEARLAIEGLARSREEHLEVRAPVNWGATIRRAIGRPATATLVTRRWRRRHDLPENRLAARALAALSEDAATLALPGLSPAEREPLARLAEEATRRASRPPWARLAGCEMPTLDEVEDRVGSHPLRSAAYRPLVAWWRQWLEWAQPHPGRHQLLDPALEPHLLFELLVLFELVAEMARRTTVRQRRRLAGASAAPLFTARLPDGPLLIYYQSGAMLRATRSLEAIAGVPDIVIELPGEPRRFVLLDAKNYGPQNHTQALYKLLGYLYQFGYDAGGAHQFDRVLAGVLTFSTEEREGRGLHNWQREQPGAQAVLAFTLPPIPDPRYGGMAAFVDWLLAAARAR